MHLRMELRLLLSLRMDDLECRLCPQKETAELYAMHRLDDSAALAFQTHLGACKICRDFVNFAQEFAYLLRQASRHPESATRDS